MWSVDVGRSSRSPMAESKGCAKADNSPSLTAASRNGRTRRVVAVVCAAIAVVWLLLSLPTIVYHLPQVRKCNLSMLLKFLVVHNSWEGTIVQ